MARLQRSDNAPAVAFFSIALIGLGLSIALTLHAAFSRPPLVVSNAIHHRHGLIDTVTVTVHNKSARTTYCPVVSISALNRDGLDIEAVTATAVEGEGKIVPGDIEGFTAVFTHITAKDYREQLASFQGFILHQNPCNGS